MDTAAAAPRIKPSELAQHRAHLLKFAMLRLGEKHAAEEVVQEVYVAALKGTAGFAGKSSVRTWLTSILLHKIADYCARAGRECSLEAQAGEDRADGVEALWRSGDYAAMLAEWRDREDALVERRFFEVLEGCLARLSPRDAHIFLLRELIGLSIDELCAETGLSATNCSVILHRVRMRLRACLEARWFAERP